MDKNDTELSAELQMKLDEVERNAANEEAKQPRFDLAKAKMVAVLCFGLAFTLGVALRKGVVNSLIFGIFLGIVGFVTAGFQKGKNK